MTTRTAAGPLRIWIGAVLAVPLALGCTAASSPTPSLSQPSQPPDPTPIASASASPGAAPTSVAVIDSFSWQRIAAIQPSSGPGYVAMAASPRGYAILTPVSVWFSTDGRAWARSLLPFPRTTSNGVVLEAHANAIAGGPRGFVVVGGQDVKPCDHAAEGAGGPPPCLVAPISWSSADGISWTSSLPNPVPAAGAALPSYTEFVSIWPADGGWDAAAEAHASVVSSGNALLHSNDGLIWTSRKAAPLPAGAASSRDVAAHGGVAAGNGTRLVWQYTETTAGTYAPRTTLATTADGKAWTQIPSFDGANAIVRFLLAPEAPATRPWLLIGDRSEQGPTVTWWQSDDLGAWRSGPAIASGRPMASSSALGVRGAGYIMLGMQELEADPQASAGDEVPPMAAPGTFLSDDGMHWRAAGFAGAPPIEAPVLMADGPKALIGLGAGETEWVVWLGSGPTP